jgi:hypothetical protein
VGFNPLYALAASDDVSCQNFSRLSSRLSVETISHNSAFLMKAWFDNRTGGSFAGLGILEVGAPED